jgi:hypothetical protein
MLKRSKNEQDDTSERNAGLNDRIRRESPAASTKPRSLGFPDESRSLRSMALWRIASPSPAIDAAAPRCVQPATDRRHSAMKERHP